MSESVLSINCQEADRSQGRAGACFCPMAEGAALRMMAFWY